MTRTDLSSRTVGRVYADYFVPPNLQRHMLRAAAVADLILKTWQGPAVSRPRILRVLLVHDTGNLVKADFDRAPELLQEEMPRLAYWRKVRKTIVEKYGTDDHAASLAIARELGLSTEELVLMDRKLFKYSDCILQSDDWEAKVAAYADQRVGPYGVLPLLERLREVQRRREAMNSPQFEWLIQCAVKIEEQVMNSCGLVAGAINDVSIAPILLSLRNFCI